MSGSSLISHNALEGTVHGVMVGSGAQRIKQLNIPTSDNLLSLSIDAADQSEGEEKPSKDATRRIIPTIVAAPSNCPDQSPVFIATTPSKLPTSKLVEPGKADDEATTGMSISPIPRSNVIEILFIAFSVLETLAERASRYSMNLDDRIERDVSKFVTGGYAIVYQGTLRPQGAMVAIKTFRFGHKSDISIIKVHDVRSFHHGT